MGVGCVVSTATLEAGGCITHLVCEGSAVAACKNVRMVLIVCNCAPLVKDPNWSICCEFVPVFSSGEAEDHGGMGLSIEVLLVAKPAWWAGMMKFVVPHGILHKFTMYFSTVTYIAFRVFCT